MAVMMHDLGGVYGKVDEKTHQLTVSNPQLRVSFKKDPLSFFMTLADQIQDFARPDVRFAAEPGGTRATFAPRCHSVRLDWEAETKTLTIIYHYKRDYDSVQNRDVFLPKNELHYFHPENGYLDYEHTGIRRIKLAAKLDKKK